MADSQLDADRNNCNMSGTGNGPGSSNGNIRVVSTDVEMQDVDRNGSSPSLEEPIHMTGQSSSASVIQAAQELPLTVDQGVDENGIATGNMSSSSSSSELFMTPQGPSPEDSPSHSHRQPQAQTEGQSQGQHLDPVPVPAQVRSEESGDIDAINIDIDLNASNSSSENINESNAGNENANVQPTESMSVSGRNEDTNANEAGAASANVAEPVQEEALPVQNENPDLVPDQIDEEHQRMIALIGNEVAVFDEQAEEFRRRFFHAILRRGGDPAESPPEYEEFDEDDNIDLIEEIVDDDDDSYDGISTGPPSSRDDRDREQDSDEPLHGPIEREEVSSVPVFDLQLPSRHSYLGDEMEALSGRTILEGGATTEIPLVLLEFHLVPGQTLPLTVFHAVTQSALRNCVPNNRHFGIVHSGLNDVNIRSPLPRRALGTTAEIYEFQEERDPQSRTYGHRMPSSVNIKAKGRHRFNVLSTYRQSDGHLMAKVKIRPEVTLCKPWRNMMSPGHRHLFPGTGTEIYNAREAKARVSSSARSRKSSSGSSGSGGRARLIKRQALLANSRDGDSVSSNSNDPVHNSGQGHSKGTSPIELEDSDSMASRSESWCGRDADDVSGRLEMNRQKSKYYSALTPWPYFVYEQFDEEVLVHRIHRKLRLDLSSLVAASVIVPKDATDLSFWLAQNLTMSDALRLQMLKMDTPVERLRFANKLLDKVSRVIECAQCKGVIASHSDIFSMSVEGPQGTYVNPMGFVHELITVTKIKGIVYRGHPSTESSWFPGYSWRITECRICGNHTGWKFEAVEKLKPAQFWGLARRSVNFKYDFSVENDCPDLDSPPRPPAPSPPDESPRNRGNAMNESPAFNRRHSRGMRNHFRSFLSNLRSRARNSNSDSDSNSNANANANATANAIPARARQDSDFDDEVD